jgi:hypothetical protein
MKQTDLLERLKAGTNNRKTIRFPGSDMDVTLSVLSEAQRQEAHFETEQYFKHRDIEVSMVTIDAYEAEKSLRMVYKALSDSEGKPLSSTIERFRGLLTVDEKSILVDEYLALERDCSPGHDLGEEEIDAILDDVKKNPTAIGNVSSIGTARQLITSLVNRLATLQQASGSTS